MPPRHLHRSFHAMGTPCELMLVAAPGAPHLEDTAEAAMQEVQRLERRYSRYRDDSDLAAINRAAASGQSIEVDAETAALLDYAQACHVQSEGRFDVTSGLLRQAWRFGTGAGVPAGGDAGPVVHRLPRAEDIARLQQRVGWGRLRWESPTLSFPQPGMELDLGGIVKEYAVDRLATLLGHAGVAGGYVNLGGDLRVLGPQADGAPWRIGIRDPLRPGAVMMTLEMTQGALASSGDYERCIVVEGRRYGHILDARTGWPVQHLAAVSVMAPLCTVAGSLATLGMLFDAEGPAWLGASGLPHVWVDANGRVGGSLAP